MGQPLVSTLAGRIISREDAVGLGEYLAEEKEKSETYSADDLPIITVKALIKAGELHKSVKETLVYFRDYAELLSNLLNAEGVVSTCALINEIFVSATPVRKRIVIKALCDHEVLKVSDILKWYFEGCDEARVTSYENLEIIKICLGEADEGKGKEERQSLRQETTDYVRQFRAKENTAPVFFFEHLQNLLNVE